MKRLSAAFLLVSLIMLSACNHSNAESYTAYTTGMDTSASITVYGGGAADTDDCIKLFKELEKQLSVTDEGSAVYRLNTNGSVEASGDLQSLIDASNRFYLQTCGAFNPCIYPLVKLWGFTENKNKVPDSESISFAVQTVAGSALSVENCKAVLSDGAMVDFGGIAKGYTSEKMCAKLKENGVTAAIISLGGNIQTMGRKPNGTPWVVGINAPNGNGLVGTLALGEAAVVTSGSYIRNFTQNGKLYHHIIDPKTGYPVDNGLVSVTVVASDGVSADALATAFFVMGKEKALSVYESFGVEAVFITEDTVSVTKGLEQKFTPDESIEGVYKIELLD